MKARQQKDSLRLPKRFLTFRPFRGDERPCERENRMSPKPLFQDRAEAGRRLAAELSAYASDPDVVVLALPRGGVPVAFEVAEVLGAPLDVFLVRKIGVPGNEELALGAIASGGTGAFNHGLIEALGLSSAMVERLVAEERRELERRQRVYRGDRDPLSVVGRTVILVDDGMATGASMLAAVAALRPQQPARIIIAIPVAAASTCDEIRPEVNALVCLAKPELFSAVGQWYEEFSQVTDDEVCYLLKQAVLRRVATPAGGKRASYRN